MKKEFTISYENIKNIMESCKAVMGKGKNAREMFMKIKMVVNGNQLTASALDGYKLCFRTVDIITETDESFEFLTDYVNIPKWVYARVSVDFETKTVSYTFIHDTIIKPIQTTENFFQGLDKFKADHKTEFKIAFNPQYLVEILKTFDKSDVVVFDFGSPIQPCIIRKARQEVDYNILLPIRLPDTERME